MSLYKRDQLCSIRIIYFAITCILLVISISIWISTFMDVRHRTLPRYEDSTIENEQDSESAIGIKNMLKNNLQDRDERASVTEVFGLRHERPALMPDMPNEAGFSTATFFYSHFEILLPLSSIQKSFYCHVYCHIYRHYDVVVGIFLSYRKETTKLQIDPFLTDKDEKSTSAPVF